MGELSQAMRDLGFTVIHEHDDGDLTLETREGRRYVATVDGRFYREVPSPGREASQRHECAAEAMDLLDAGRGLGPRMAVSAVAKHISEVSTVREGEALAALLPAAIPEESVGPLGEDRRVVGFDSELDRDMARRVIMELALSRFLDCACDPNRPLKGKEV